MFRAIQRFLLGRAGAAVLGIVGVAASIGLLVYSATAQLWKSLPAVVLEAMRDSLMFYLLLFVLMTIGIVVLFARHRSIEGRQREAETLLALERKRLCNMIELRRHDPVGLASIGLSSGTDAPDFRQRQRCGGPSPRS